MTAHDLLPYVSHVIDTALSPDHGPDEITKGTYLVAWQCGFEPLVVAVIPSYTEAVDELDAEDIAKDWLREIGWFGKSGPRDADYIVRLGERDADTQQESEMQGGDTGNRESLLP